MLPAPTLGYLIHFKFKMKSLETAPCLLRKGASALKIPLFKGGFRGSALNGIINPLRVKGSLLERGVEVKAAKFYPSIRGGYSPDPDCCFTA